LCWACAQEDGLRSNQDVAVEVSAWPQTVTKSDATPAPAASPAGRDRGDPAQGRPATPHDEDDDQVPFDTAAAVAHWHPGNRDLHPAEIAARIGRSARTVRRYGPPVTATRGRAVNRHTVHELADSPQPLTESGRRE
jgi:hypothetical protein